MNQEQTDVASPRPSMLTPAPGDECGKEVRPREIPAREILISDINDQEQRLLDKLAALRALREEVTFCSRSEQEKILKVTRLVDRLRF